MVAATARAQIRSASRLAVTRRGALVVLTGAAGVAFRAWVYRSVIGIPSSDEALSGLIARHVLHGEFHTFFWAMAYGGTQEPIVTAPIFWVFGSSWLALRIVPIVLSGLAALLVWRVGRRTIGEPAATVAGVLFWVWPAYNLIQLTHQLGFYGSDVFYCALLLLLALRVVERPDAVRAGLFGLALGLAFWETAQIVPIAVPVVAWTVWKQPRALRLVWVAAPLAALGALPWLLWNAGHDWASLSTAYGAQSTYAHRIRTFLSPLLPMTVGLRQPWTQQRFLPAALTLALEALLAAAFVYGAWRTRRRNASLLYVVPVVFPFFYAISEWTIESSDPRYLVVLTPVLALLAAQVATTFPRGVALVALGCLISAVVLHKAQVNARAAARAQPQTGAPADFRPLIATLDRLGIHRVYSSYWVAYRLAFESNERIIAVKNDLTGVTWDGTQARPSLGAFIRYPPYERKVREGRHAFVLYKADVASSPIVPKLRRFGYRAYPVEDLVVYWLPPNPAA
jgi:4-amino-4-deoxy-L-arabinose transferase-like glycosyltransferase